MKKIAIVALAAPFVLSASPGGSLGVKVTGIKHTRGVLLTCLWTQKRGFPTCQKSKTARKLTRKITGSTMNVRFPNVAPGTYTVTVHHDEDGNGKLKTNFIGMPREGVGVSNNPNGIPRFKKAMVRVNGSRTITVKMRYL